MTIRSADCHQIDNFVTKVQKRSKNDPTKSMTAIAQDLRLSKALIHKCVSEDLCYHSYKMQKGQFLGPKAKETHLEKLQRLLSKLKHPAQPKMLWFFSNEKNFCQDQKMNQQNNCWLAYCPKDVPRVMQTKFPATVMVFGIRSLDDVMPLHVFPKGLRVNSDIYIELLKTKVLPWIKVAKDRSWVWQQDCTLPHIRKINLLDFIQFL